MGVMKLTREIIEKSDHHLFIKEAEIDGRDLPMLIGEQVDKLNQLDNSIKKAIKAAESANESASQAKDQSAGFGKKKVAIEQLQSASYDLAKAVQSGTTAQKVSFEFQTKLAEISKYLFGLGVSNIANNRFVVRELELKLKGASQKELSRLAQQEIVTVVKQLKEQEDLLFKLENLSKSVKEQDLILQIQTQFNQDVDRRFDEQVKVDLQNDAHWKQHAKVSERLEGQLKAHAVIDEKIEKKLKNQDNIIKHHNEKLKKHQEVCERHDKTLEIYGEINEQHSKALREYAKVDKNLENQLIAQSTFSQEKIEILFHRLGKHDEKLINLDEKDNGIDKEINLNREMIKVQAKEIGELTDEIHNLKMQLDTKVSTKMSKVNLGIAISAFLFSLAHFFI